LTIRGLAYAVNLEFDLAVFETDIIGTLRALEATRNFKQTKN